MSKKETRISILILCICMVVALVASTFVAILIDGIMIVSYIGWFLYCRRSSAWISTFFKIYTVSVLIGVLIVLAILSFIFYGGYKYKDVNNVDNIDYVLVLGSRLENEQITDVLKMRLDKSLEYYSSHNDIDFIVSGGSVGGNSKSEANAMCEYLESRGVDPLNIILEDKAQSTYENIQYTKNILSKLGKLDKKVLIVTSDFHISRAMMIADFFNLNNYALSSDTPLESIISYYVREVLAFTKDFLKCLINIK